MTNGKSTKRYPYDRSFGAHLAEQMKAPEFAREYEALGPEFEIVGQIIALRLKRQLTQAQLAAKVGTPQPSIARLESTRAVKNLDYVRRVADALDAKLEVKLIPREKLASRAKSRKKLKA
jgi:ribosome-binding protein aMBF1 (putative translation factor)